MGVRNIVFFILIILQTGWTGLIISDFKLKNIENSWIILSEVESEKLTVIDFWATWCKLCTKAIPKLNLLSCKFKNEGVSFIGINVDSPRNSAKIKPFVKIH